MHTYSSIKLTTSKITLKISQIRKTKIYETYLTQNTNIAIYKFRINSYPRSVQGRNLKSETRE